MNISPEDNFEDNIEIDDEIQMTIMTPKKDIQNLYEEHALKDNEPVIIIPRGNYEISAALIDASFSGRPYAKQMIRKGLTGTKWYRFYTNLIWIRSILLIALLIFTFFERPSWCYSKDCSLPRDSTKVMKGVKPIVMQSGLPKIGVIAGLSIELSLLILIWLSSVLGPLFFLGLRASLLRPR